MEVGWWGTGLVKGAGWWGAARSGLGFIKGYLVGGGVRAVCPIMGDRISW